MSEATLSSKNQIVIPREAREALGLKAGDKVLVLTRGDSVIVLRKLQKRERTTSGPARKTYPEDYLQEERESWG
jgi:AbrB family looped-hinge helix DNA binding protein